MCLATVQRSDDNTVICRNVSKLLCVMLVVGKHIVQKCYHFLCTISATFAL